MLEDGDRWISRACWPVILDATARVQFAFVFSQEGQCQSGKIGDILEHMKI